MEYTSQERVSKVYIFICLKNSRRSIYGGGVMAVLPLKCYLNDKVVWLCGLRGVTLYTFTRLHRVRGTPAFYTGHVSQHPNVNVPIVYACTCMCTRIIRCSHALACVYIVYTYMYALNVYIYIHTHRYVTYTGSSRILHSFSQILGQFRSIV